MGTSVAQVKDLLRKRLRELFKLALGIVLIVSQRDYAMNNLCYDGKVHVVN